MTKHRDITRNPSQFFVKTSSEYCNLCGVRSNFCIEISYPDNAETKIKNSIDFAKQIQGSRHTTNHKNDIHDFIGGDDNDSSSNNNNNDNLIRICKKCLNHCLKLLYEEERLYMSHIR